MTKMKDFFKRWLVGIKNIEPKQQLQISILSQIWQVIGILLANIYVFFTEHSYWFIFLFGVAIGIIWRFYVTLKTYENLKKTEKELENLKKTS